MSKVHIVSALIHAVVFAVFLGLGNWIFHWGMNWLAILVGGVLYGLLMAWVDRFLEKRKNKAA